MWKHRRAHESLNLVIVAMVLTDFHLQILLATRAHDEARLRSAQVVRGSVLVVPREDPLRTTLLDLAPLLDDVERLHHVVLPVLGRAISEHILLLLNVGELPIWPNELGSLEVKYVLREAELGVI